MTSDPRTLTEADVWRILQAKVARRNGKRGIEIQPSASGSPLFFETLAPGEIPDAIIAAPLRWGPGVRGADLRICSGCLAPVTIAPSTQAVAACYPKVPILCVPCLAVREGF